MSLALIALLLALTLVTGVVLADSGLRMWSAVGAMKAQRLALETGLDLPQLRAQRGARVVTRFGCARMGAPAPQRVAA